MQPRVGGRAHNAGWAIVATLALGILACGRPAEAPTPSQSDEPRYGGQLNVRADQDPYDWDITYTGKTGLMGDSMGLAYDSLLSFKSGPGIGHTEMILQPRLAERWQAAPDGRSFTFYLRKGVKYANQPPLNGREVTSADAKFAYEYLTRTGELEKKNLPQAQMSWMFEGLKNIETPDRYTLVVSFDEPFVPFLSYAASEWTPVLPREIYEQEGHYKDRILGSGPYQLDRGASQQTTRWVFKKNPDYWDAGKPYLDEIRWLVLRDEAAELAAFQSKQLDVVQDLGYREAQDLMKTYPQAGMFEYTNPLGFRFFVSQVRKGPMNDLRVRKALDLAIDRDEILRTVAGGKGKWSMPGVFPDTFTAEEARRYIKYDPEEAKRLLAQAGFENGVDLEWIIVNNESPTNMAWIQLVQAQVKKVGMNINLKLLERQEQRKRKYAGDYDLDYGVGLGNAEADIDSTLFASYYSRSSYNNSKVNDPVLDDLVLAQRRETDPAKRQDLIRRASIRLQEMSWAPYLIYPPKFTFWQPHVKSYHPHFGSKAEFPFVWMER